METTSNDSIGLLGPKGSLSIDPDDKPTIKLAMLFEGQCFLGPIKAAQKYGYSKQRYFQLLHAYEETGSDALISKKTGPRSNYVRTENVKAEIIRHRLLDPDAGTEVIAQKMKQSGFRISKRSVERTIAEHGLQKKTLSVSTKTTTND
jgi:transposase